MAESFRSPRKILRRLRYLPLARRKVSNWCAFLFNYALGLQPKCLYMFRNGASLAISRPLDHAVILEIFLREEYGTAPDRAVVLDIGASIGAYSSFVMSTARELTVYAYEPMPEFFALLEQNAARNRREATIHCFNSAVAGRRGERSLYLGGSDFFFPTLIQPNSGATAATRVVPTTTLSEILESHSLAQVDLLKMDCEGAEYEIFYATPLSCLARIKEVRLEYHNLDTRRRCAESLSDFLTNSGFDVYRLSAASESNGMLWARRRNPQERLAND